MVVRNGTRVGAPVAECMECGRQAPCVWSTYKQNVAVVLAYFGSERRGRFCKRCSAAICRRLTIVTALVGWPSVRSLFIAPYYVVANVKEYSRASRMIAAAERELRRSGTDDADTGDAPSARRQR